MCVCVCVCACVCVCLCVHVCVCVFIYLPAFVLGHLGVVPDKTHGKNPLEN